MQSWRSDKGFSLVEVMVVVAITGLMASAVMLTIPDEEDALDDVFSQTDRVVAALSRQAIISGQVLGVRFHTGGFTVLSLTDDGWVPQTDLLKADMTDFGGAVVEALVVENKPVDFEAEGTGAHIWFLPTGDRPAFSLTLGKGAQRGTMAVPFSGKMVVVPHV